MSLLAESLVEEFLNRMGFFTVRGLKRGVHEIDLLGLKYEEGKPRGIHVEAQISFRPVSYITKLPKKYARETSASSRTTVKKRSPDLMKLCVEDWVNLKFHDVKKVNLRNKMI